MDAQFESVAYDVINQFLERIADRCLVPQDKLWALWRDMYQDFPTKNKKKVTVTKKDEKEPVIVEKIVLVDKPVIVEKIVLVDKPVIVEKIVLVEKSDTPVIKSDAPVEPVALVEPAAPVEQQPVDNTEKPVEKPFEKPAEKTPPKKTVEKTPPKKEKEGCQFIITRGERSGMACGANVPRRDKDIGHFCKNHIPK